MPEELDYAPIDLVDCVRDPAMTQNKESVWWHIPIRRWPSLFVQIVEWGCCGYSYLDIRIGQIYEGAPFSPDGRFLVSVLAPRLELWTRDEWLDRAW